ncbi:MAG: CopD family protein [Deltaproteobacteria bacterium]|nr:CopD family protein [Deltaproteobacteria bacterium]
MDPKVYDWLKAGHLIGDFLWVGSMFAVYWLMRFHTHAPKEAHEKLILQERSMAMMMDVAAALAIGTGIALILYRPGDGTIFSEKPAGWFHIKLTIIVLGLLSMHGMLRAKVKKFSNGEVPSMPQWHWTIILSSVVAVLIVVFVVQGAMKRGAGEEAAKKAAAQLGAGSAAPAPPPSP